MRDEIDEVGAVVRIVSVRRLLEMRWRLAGLCVLTAALCIAPVQAGEIPVSQERASIGRQPEVAKVLTPQAANASWRALLAKELQKRKVMPEEVQRNGRKVRRVALSGQVKIAVEFAPTGEILRSSVVTTGGRSEIDAAALAMAPAGAKFPPPPPRAGDDQITRLEIIINFEGAQAGAAAHPPAAHR
jgi:TonB family protein